MQQEIFEIEKNLELMSKAIADKSYVIKVAHTRLEARMHRPEIELCRDYAHMRFVSMTSRFDTELDMPQQYLTYRCLLQSSQRTRRHQPSSGENAEGTERIGKPTAKIIKNTLDVGT